MFIANNYNFELKYILTKHIESDEDRVYSTGEVKLLFAETNNRCGLCKNTLVWNLEQSINSKKNQIAHIYGKKLFAKAKLPLSKKYHISNVSEINQYHNLIILCDKCHLEYDNNPTYDKYTKMLDAKEHVARTVSSKTFVYFALEDILERIREGAFSSVVASEVSNLEEYQKTSLQIKLNFNEINQIKTNKVLNDMVLYFKVIQEIVNEIGKEKEYLKIYNNAYLQLKNLYEDKNEILNLIDSTLIDSDYNLFCDIIPIVTSYMIMNCEVLDNVAK